MKKRRARQKREIPEALGNRVCGIWPYVLVLVLNAVFHSALLFCCGLRTENAVRLFFSFIFFIYPLSYVTDMLWSLRPSVCRILSGETAVNRKYYMNTVRKEIDREALLPVTISIPVYLESNEVIFETLKESLAAAARYRAYGGGAANVVVSDDGLAPLLGGSCTREKVRRILEMLERRSPGLSPSERQAAERLRFYKTHEIAFVARPAKGRAGLFKKASNLNYTLRLGTAMADGASWEELSKEDGGFAEGYWEGEIKTDEIILLLDKDSGVREGIIEAIVPEFAEDDQLAYVQCAANAVNLEENYYTGATGYQIDQLFHRVWPCKALQGFFVPLVGHHVFIRRSLLEKSGLWAENRVSEDYDKALCFYRMGCHGKYAQIRGLEFTEYASRTFTEETGKQRRYAYGMFEMLFDGTVFSGKLRSCDRFYMLLYFCSVINQVLLLPTVLLESYFGNIHLLWAGFLFCMLCFILLPLLRDLVTRRRYLTAPAAAAWPALIIAVSFVGHSFSFLAGAVRYLANKVRENRTPFPSTNVDRMNGSFMNGVRLLAGYIRGNPLFLLMAFLCLDRGIFLLTRKGLAPVTAFTYGYILFGAALTPIFLTPPLVAGFLRSYRGSMVYRSVKETDFSPIVRESTGMTGMAGEDKDKESFLSDYRDILQASIAREKMPEEVLQKYIFDSCLREDDRCQKALYLLRRKRDGAKAMMRVTRDYPVEDALEEARLLRQLDHPGIPKVWGCYEEKGRHYFIREYVEGRTLYEIVRAKGCLSPEDVFGIARRLAKILCYLHAQTPPVIHRDIKPQNIIVGRDGTLHLIDFGIAREHKRLRRQDTSIVLTRDYASPEQYGFEQTTPLSDIYSLGMVLLFLTTGRTGRFDLEAQIVNNRLRELIGQCIAFTPKMRFQSAEEICAFLDHDSGAGQRRGRRAYALAGVLACACCFSVAAYWAGFFVERGRARARSYEHSYQSGYTDGYDSAPVFVRGTAGDLTREGAGSENMAVSGGAFAAEGDGQVFYLTEQGVWSMSPNGTDQKILAEDGQAEGLSFQHGWLYYSSGDDLIQMNLYTAERNVLSKAGRLLPMRDRLLIQNEEGVFCLEAEMGEWKAMESFSASENLYTDGERLYFISGEDHALYRGYIDGSEPDRLLKKGCRSICLLGDDVFCAVEEETGRLIRIDSETQEMESLLEVEAGMLHAAQEGICFLDLSEETVFFCSVDGRIRKRVSENRARDVNVAGGWVFYHNEEDGGRLWCVRPDGSNDHPLA